MKVAELVRMERARLDISQRELSNRCNVSPLTITRVEHGQRCLDQTLYAICDALHIDIDVMGKAIMDDFIGGCL
jgi:transcriptional regulator with XRE-family HTH domain